MKAGFVFLIIFLFVLARVYQVFPDLEGHPELIIKTKNGPTSVTFSTELVSSHAWAASWLSYPQNYLTTESKYTDPDDLTMPGVYSGNDMGFNTDIQPNENEFRPVLGRGIYEMSVGGKDERVYFTIDCYGSTFNFPDKTIWFNYTQNTFEDESGNSINSIVLYYGPEGLQPTPPQSFHCTNPTAYGQHPQFEWETPEEPDGVTFYYNIYLDLGAGYRKITANPLTATEYTDTGIEIIKFGSNTAHYYVTAKGSGSPESDASNIVDIKTNTAEKILPEQEMPDNKEANYVEPSQIRLLGNYPNPFNTTTVIKFKIPTKMPVKAAVYNLLGEEIRILFDGDKPAGRYDITWDGKNEDGLIMPSGIYLGILTTANQREVKKLILAK